MLKYNEPPEARKPVKSWRLYVFKGKEQVGQSQAPAPVSLRSKPASGRARRLTGAGERRRHVPCAQAVRLPLWQGPYREWLPTLACGLGSRLLARMVR